MIQDSGGLEGVSVADTQLSDVDGERGRLIIAGQDVEQTAGATSFERLCATLWGLGHGVEFDEGDVRAALASARDHAFAQLPQLRTAVRMEDGMDALRGAIAQLQLDKNTRSLDENARLTGAMAVFAAAWFRLGQMRFEAGLYQQATAAFQSASRGRATWPEAQYNLALSYWSMGAHDLALIAIS